MYYSITGLCSSCCRSPFESWHMKATDPIVTHAERRGHWWASGDTLVAGQWLRASAARQ